MRDWERVARSFFDVPDSFLLPLPAPRSMVDALSGDGEYCIAKLFRSVGKLL